MDRVTLYNMTKEVEQRIHKEVRSNITPGCKVTFYTVDFNGSGSITISMKKLVTEPGEDYDVQIKKIVEALQHEHFNLIRQKSSTS